MSPQVRNLTYMVTRREKMKRSLCRIHEQIFQHQVRLLDHELLNGESRRRRTPRTFVWLGADAAPLRSLFQATPR